MEKTCPYCGTPLPKEASFCPHCAKNIHLRTPVKPPKRIPIKALRIAAFLLLLTLFAAFLFYYFGPKTYDGMGEVIYTDSDGTYQLLINDSMDRYLPKARLDLETTEEPTRFPSWLYINHRDTGSDAGGVFMQKVTSCTVEIKQPDSESPILCSEPEAKDFNAGAARVSLIDYTKESPSLTQIVWTLQMENGDTIHIRCDLSLTPVNTFHYDSEDADLSTSQALQTFVDQLAAQTSYTDLIYITLPPVVYTEPVILHGRSFSLTGSQSDGQRTTFTAGIQMRDSLYWISEFTGIDFIGDGTGIGLSTAGRVWTNECRFINWKTALLSYGNVWVNTTDCVFEQNGIGFHFNATDSTASDTHFTGNIFQDNATAVLLEEVPTDVKMDFSECLFSGNTTDIDNRCDQPIDISNAVFQ